MKTKNLKASKTLIALSCLTIMACAPTEHEVYEPVQTGSHYLGESEADSASADEDGVVVASDDAFAMSEQAPTAPTQSAEPNWNTERYRAIEEASFKNAQISPLSTFAIDVDTAGYSIIRSYLTRGQMPPAGAVRIEEMLNNFDYN